MSRRLMTGLVAVLVVVVAWTTNATAHQLGLAQAELIEGDEATYVLDVRAAAGVASVYGTPVLPDRCRYHGNPREGIGAERIRFGFRCEGGPLTFGDALVLPWQRDGVMLEATWLDGGGATRFFRRNGDTITVSLATLQARSGSLWDAAERYVGLGIEHILFGIDHLLFVLGLLLLVRGPWMLVKTITAFTVAHSITLALSTLGVVRVPSGPVEAMIALSIVILAAEIVYRRRGKTTWTGDRPWAVAFGFGLLHGLGFAGALGELGLPEGEIPMALLFFNVGVEIGQLCFVAVVLGVGWLLRRCRTVWPQWVEAAPVYALGSVAAFWFLQRSGVILGTT